MLDNSLSNISNRSYKQKQRDLYLQNLKISNEAQACTIFIDGAKKLHKDINHNEGNCVYIVVSFILSFIWTNSDSKKLYPQENTI